MWRDKTPGTSSVKSYFRVRSNDPFRKEGEGGPRTRTRINETSTTSNMVTSRTKTTIETTTTNEANETET